MAHLTETVPTVRRRYEGQLVEERAVDLVAAEYRHTTARGVMEGDAPDVQIHSHVVITSASREDGRLVAVASRPIFRSARELGAYYRSALAHELTERGYRIERGTGKNGRYFEIEGVPRSMLDAFSQRSREVARAAERFRAQYGRATRDTPGARCAWPRYGAAPARPSRPIFCEFGIDSGGSFAVNLHNVERSHAGARQVGRPAPGSAVR